MQKTDIALLIIRLIVGVTLILHGLNHAFGGGKVAGTAEWFESLGMKYGKLQALLSIFVEILAGLALILGIFTPLAVASIISVMLVAGVTSHRNNGFFVFKDGYEYVLMIGIICVAVGVAGAGMISIDHLLGMNYDSWVGIKISVGLGVLGAAALLAIFWRPLQKSKG
ncbi:DoxX family protein [Rhodococcus sp. IEGM 1366]|uniref:DoxX family protein n=1 Tax=Rhodococcus sp. IEGM 1366 TaxID=3082223 RepID=UPI002953516D|nr:DoxX family protein [Rhodococcus sp. IEGM 1366]MDV8071360.1 DoxX family protein [Rhodococcus sp. IEGM 1366]